MNNNTEDAATSTLQEHDDVITDASEVLPAFCQSLEAILRQGLKRGLGVIRLADRDYWNCIEGLTTSSKVLNRVTPSISHVISVVQQCPRVCTSLSRGRLFLRLALVKGVLVQAIKSLVDNQVYVKYWYKDYSVLVDYREKGVVIDILKSLKKKTYKLNINDCTFLDETWLIPTYQRFEFVPCAFLGMTLFTWEGKCIIIDVAVGSAADENAVQPGDCLDELHGQLIDERWSCRIGELKRKNRGKPITATIVKGRFPDGRWFSPLYRRFAALCSAGKCSMLTQKEQPKENYDPNNQENERLLHTFYVNYHGSSDVGSNGSCIFVQDGVKKLLQTEYKSVRLKLQLMERDIVLTKEDGEVFKRYSYTETSSCAVYDTDPSFFGFMVGNTTCSFADKFECCVFSSDTSFMSKKIIEGIGKGFDRTVYCVLTNHTAVRRSLSNDLR